LSKKLVLDLVVILGQSVWFKNTKTINIRKEPSHTTMIPTRNLLPDATLQRKNAETLKQIFPEKEYPNLSPNFHIHVSVSELYIPTKVLPFLLEEICGQILGIYKSLTDT
jgi:hypothetical protein